ncbi:glutamate--tRNA ligase 2 [Malaciobacter pacificus]|uniref:Glutamate--tRNA ligase n=1 Tax=Malaciobacter pacificus TaxID=1080223 RepID=A0A5C2H8Q8_9BACT|nr:glutamate--tRNA ligase [Malaciobacter pacificus]QEP33254.1 glutamyl-tRNA synthetase [Malaciobacter pacificus]GGD41350.1 glutamate--tRNA ligase 2 [Malaciobacter pacificus]
MAITRFAPSPTGYLHIGGLRTALYSYLWAKKTGGEFKLRIEDTDNARNNEDAVKAILEAFEWVGMPSDCEIEYQSKRIDIYKKYIAQLLEEGKAYKCYMSRDELDALRASQEAAKQNPRYDGTWRPEEGKVLPEIPEGVEPVIRIKAPLEGKIEFEDGVKGKMSFDANQVDDFVIARANGMPIYNFVVAIDDHLMGMTDVLRGDDHLSNTPKQIVIYNALGFDVPKFYHMPMINNPAGKKLSKRDGAMDVMQYKRDGYLPEALLNFLVRLGWSNGDQEIFSMDEMLELFDPNNINKSASAYNAEKLLWLNAHYIKNVSNERLAKELEFFDCNLEGHDKKEMLLDLCKERAQTLIELKDAINNILEVPTEYDAKGTKKFVKEGTIEMLNDYLALLEANKDSLHLAPDYEAITKPFIEENGLKFPQLFQPIRIALTGGTQAPSVYDITAILGFEETKSRINSAISKNFGKE